MLDIDSLYIVRKLIMMVCDVKKERVFLDSG